MTDDGKKVEIAQKIRITFLSQEEAQEALEKKLRETICKKSALTRSEAHGAILKLYEEASAIQKPFGETVAEIMRIKGITKVYRGKEILDVPKAVSLTKLNPNIFRENMYKANCTVDMALVISMSIGFQLGPTLTDRLLKAAGLAYRLDNPEHIAYIFLLEYCSDLNIEQCNKILEELGIPKTRRLGSYGRRPDGESMEYKRKK
jgi:hypothetical protein